MFPRDNSLILAEKKTRSSQNISDCRYTDIRCWELVITDDGRIALLQHPQRNGWRFLQAPERRDTRGI